MAGRERGDVVPANGRASGRASGRATARDVARRAGVSQSTVSYVLNDTPNQTISDATRQRVLAAAQELDYTPSAAARALRRGTSQIVLTVLPNAPIGYTIAEFIDRLTDVLEPEGYTVLYRRHRGEPMLQRFLSELAPAAIVNLAALPADDVERVTASGVPFVNSALDEAGHLDTRLSETEIGRLQAAHLLERGHRTLGYASPTYERVDYFMQGRLAGVRQVCAAAGLAEPAVVGVPLDVTGAAAAMARLRTEHPEVTAVCAYNDEIAFAVLAGMRVLGLRAPKDLALIGVDDVPLGAFVDPPLTTIDLGIGSMSDLIGALVLDRLAGRPAGPTIDAAMTLVRRDSV